MTPFYPYTPESPDFRCHHIGCGNHITFETHILVHNSYYVEINVNPTESMDTRDVDLVARHLHSNGDSLFQHVLWQSQLLCLYHMITSLHTNSSDTWSDWGVPTHRLSIILFLIENTDHCIDRIRSWFKMERKQQRAHLTVKFAWFTKLCESNLSAFTLSETFLVHSSGRWIIYNLSSVVSFPEDIYGWTYVYTVVLSCTSTCGSQGSTLGIFLNLSPFCFWIVFFHWTCT